MEVFVDRDDLGIKKLELPDGTTVRQEEKEGS